MHFNSVFLRYFLLFALSFQILLLVAPEQSRGEPSTSTLGPLAVDVRANPDKANPGETVNLGITIENHGKKAVRLENVTLTFPSWRYNYLSSATGNLAVNRTLIVLMGVTIDREAPGGNHNIVVLATSNATTISGKTVLAVNRIDNIPLSGNIPFSILVIVLSGSILYVVFRFTYEGKFDTNYVQVTVFSIGLGLLVWTILSFFGFVIPFEGVPGSKAVFSLVIFSGAIGLVLGTATRIIMKVLKQREAKQLQNLAKYTRLRKGYADENDTILNNFLIQYLDFLHAKLGKEYTFFVRVYLKESIEGRYHIEGLLKQFESKIKPQDVILAKRFRVNADRDEIVDFLTTSKNEDPSPLVKELLDDAEYARNIGKWLKVDKNVKERSILSKIYTKLKHRLYPGQVSTEILAIQGAVEKALRRARTLEEFAMTLERLDFGKYSCEFIKSTATEHWSDPASRMIYIPGENIDGISIIGYETFCSILLSEAEETFRQVPSVYSVDDDPKIDDITAD